MKINKQIIILNAIFYTITAYLVFRCVTAPPKVIIWHVYTMVYWVFWLLLLMILKLLDVILTPAILDKAGLLTATPVIAFFFVMMPVIERDDESSSSTITSRNGYQYKETRVSGPGYTRFRRVAYYKRKGDHAAYDQDNWVKDSTWIYFSRSGILLGA